jgi:hypothetical protein
MPPSLVCGIDWLTSLVRVPIKADDEAAEIGTDFSYVYLYLRWPGAVKHLSRIPKKN